MIAVCFFDKYDDVLCHPKRSDFFTGTVPYRTLVRCPGRVQKNKIFHDFCIYPKVRTGVGTVQRQFKDIIDIMHCAVHY